MITVILVFSELSWIFCGKTMNVWFFQIYSAYCGQSFEAKLRMLTVLSFCIFGNHLEHCMAWHWFIQIILLCYTDEESKASWFEQTIQKRVVLMSLAKFDQIRWGLKRSTLFSLIFYWVLLACTKFIFCLLFLDKSKAVVLMSFAKVYQIGTQQKSANSYLASSRFRFLNKWASKLNFSILLEL